jgi:MFS transporter, DHA3 family, macrolide efflux protein
LLEDIGIYFSELNDSSDLSNRLGPSQLVDRLNLRWVMILSDTGAALSTFAIALLLFSGQVQTWHICLATAVSSSFSAFQFPAYTAATTLLVDIKNLGRASGMVEFSQAVGQLIAPVLGGVLLEIIQLSEIIILDLISFVFSVIILLLVHFPKHRRLERSKEIYRSSFFKETVSGFHYLAAQDGLITLLLLLAINNFLIGIVQVLVYPLILSFASKSQLGTILGVGGVGMVIGSILMGSWGNGRQDYIKILICFMVLDGLSLMVAGFSPSIILFGVAAFLFFLGSPFINGSVKVILQKKVLPDIQGKVFALTNTITGLCLPLAYVSAAPLAERIFEPLMSADGLLSESIGKIIGVGPGRGIGFLFITLGALTVLITIIAYQYPRLRLVEVELPDKIFSEKDRHCGIGTNK